MAQNLDILQDIDPEKRQNIYDLLKSAYPEIFIMINKDEVNRIVIDKHEILRWKVYPLLEKLQATGLIDLNRVCANDKITEQEHRKLARDIGYSLSAYFELSCVQSKF